jgi:segregation and condensation protein B
LSELARVVEALLYLSPDPLAAEQLARATESETEEVQAVLAQLAEDYAPGRRGIFLRELGGGYTFASDPCADRAARRLFGGERLSKVTQAQAEALAIVAYMQPVSRPEIARIRGVNTDHAVAALLERDLIAEVGSSRFGATLYRTSTAFLTLFGLRSLRELPDLSRWDQAPEEAAQLRERLLRAGQARAASGPHAA